jgi:hypothetical protein
MEQLRRQRIMKVNFRLPRHTLQSSGSEQSDVVETDQDERPIVVDSHTGKRPADFLQKVLRASHIVTKAVFEKRLKWRRYPGLRSICPSHLIPAATGIAVARRPPSARGRERHR